MEDPQGRQSSETPSAYQSSTFDRDVTIRVNEAVGSASISPSGRDVVLASREGLHIIDLDSPYSPPRHLPHRSPWEVADVQWSPFASRDYWIASTSNQKALVWNLELSTTHAPIEHTLHAHSRAITDINFSAHHPDMLATCAVDSYVHCWDLRLPTKPAVTFADFYAGATQVKWNRVDSHIIASSHDRYLRIWDDRKGAYPLKTIEAHSTKIYGVDWNRTRATDVLTCSLDKTIKLWDYSKDEGEPERIIRTPFPVWRARHTPFGWGVLAMPQRGDYLLHLYDRRLGEGVKRDAAVPPVKSFDGHQDQVKEFLWRSRGDIENGVDNRDFQLISWGMDRELRLHRIDSQHLRVVGHEKGTRVRQNLNLTRRGAAYKTFRDEGPGAHPSQHANGPRGLGALVSAAGMSKAPLPMMRGGADGGFLSPSVGMQARKNARKAINPITWMEGVTIGKRAEGEFRHLGSRASIQLSDLQGAWDPPETLGDEIAFVGKKYKKVTFESADVSHRTATISLNGPWGPDDKPAFLRINLKFPEGYPKNATPEFKFKRTTSTVAEETMAKLYTEVQSIVQHYQARRRGCLEAIVTYLLGERGLAESISLFPPDDALIGGLDPAAEESSSDEEDGVVDEFDADESQDMEMSGTGILAIASSANVPLPKACGALWTHDGRLICFFPPKEDPKPLFSLDTLRSNDRSSRGQRLFEGFGRLNSDSPGPRGRESSTSIIEEEASSEGSWTASSSSPSSSSESIDRLPGRFMPPAAWRGAALRFQRSSQQSSTGQGSKTSAVKPKSVVTIHNMHDLLPAKKELAEDYAIYGPGPSVCAHNAEVALRHGYRELYETWSLIKLILYDEVPLEILQQSYRREPVLVMARRAVVRVKRKDSGLDLQFDDPEAVAKPKLRGHVKWGSHPFASGWLIPALFEHFEKAADTQMLAMMSCVFSEPAAKDSVSNALMRLTQQELPMSMKCPAFSLDYFPSEDIAWSLFQEPKSGTATPNAPNRKRLSTTWEPREDRLTTYGSAGSSNGPWGSDTIPSEPLTPFTSEITPPTLSRTSTYRSSANVSFSTSPERHHTSSRRSNSNLASTFASLSRPFSITASSSPPTHTKPRASDADLSTSAPTNVVTWGANTFYSNPATSTMPQRRSSKRSSSVATATTTPYDSSYSDSDAYESADETTTTRPSSSSSGSANVRINVKLKNQNRFDDEAHASVPLLDPAMAARYAGYREAYAHQLAVWGLDMARSEVLKFNGLTSYWPEVAVTTVVAQAEEGYARQTQQVAPRASIGAQVQGQLEPYPVPLGGAYKAAEPEKAELGFGGITYEKMGARVAEKVGKKIETGEWRWQCSICWQPVLGLHVVCAECSHRGHMECVWRLSEDLERLTGKEEEGCAVGCGCGHLGEVVEVRR